MISLLHNNETSAELRSIIYWFLGRIKNDRSALVLLASFEEEIDENLIWEIAKSLRIAEGIVPIQTLCSIMMHSHDATRRAAAAYVLGGHYDSAAIGCLIQVLSNLQEEEVIRSPAAESLGVVRGKQAVDDLLKALTDASVSVRFWSAYALGELKDPRAIQPLRELAKKR